MLQSIQQIQLQS